VGQLDGQVAVVTGGGRGIGRAIARGLAHEGATVVVSARTAADLDAVVGAIASDGGRATAVVADALDRQGARRPVEVALEEHGRIDVLVNNLGGTVGRHDPFAGASGEGDDSFEATVALTLTVAWWATTAALPAMREQGHGRVVNIGSGTAKRTGGAVGYTAAKHGVVGLTRELAATAAAHGITVNCLCPGWTNTSRLDFERIGAARGTSADEVRQRAEAESLQHRILEADELVPMAVLLAGPGGAGITGQVISVDGGYKV
jgi:3-hydroxybutyrate dehydrogenase